VAPDFILKKEKEGRKEKEGGRGGKRKEEKQRKLGRTNSQENWEN